MTLTKRPSFLQDKNNQEEVMAKKKNSRELDELQASLLDDKNFLKGIIETFCQKLLQEEMGHHL